MTILEEPVKEIKEVKNYIDGEWVESKGEIVDVVNPATYQTIAKCPISTKEEIDAAIERGLNMMKSPEDIVEGLLDEFGAFPDRSIIQKYRLEEEPEKNHLPDYVLAVAVQQVISERPK